MIELNGNKLYVVNPKVKLIEFRGKKKLIAGDKIEMDGALIKFIGGCVFKDRPTEKCLYIANGIYLEIPGEVFDYLNFGVAPAEDGFLPYYLSNCYLDLRALEIRALAWDIKRGDELIINYPKRKEEIPTRPLCVRYHRGFIYLPLFEQMRKEHLAPHLRKIMHEQIAELKKRIVL